MTAPCAKTWAGSAGSSAKCWPSSTGDDFLDTVERLRTTAIRLRANGSAAHELAQELAGTGPGVSPIDSTRAFATYFRVVNIAERVHRIRRRREYERARANSSSPMACTTHCCACAMPASGWTN
jgi:phosphoenolpyruvate carboxylase